MASCYGNTNTQNVCDGKKNADHIKHLIPMKLGRLSAKESSTDNWIECELDFFQTGQEKEEGRLLMNEVIEDGLAWPFLDLQDTAAFASYFLSHTAFCVRVTASNDPNIKAGEVVGCFYIKPNFPGRCDHICNGGFITKKSAQRRGVALKMGEAFKLCAPLLGFRGSLFNLVFVTNVASQRLWTKLGFEKLARIPGCARLKGHDGYIDAEQFYMDFSKQPGWKEDSAVGN